MKDYPAAHSMDSTWFAVDEDGHIAFFDTGEGGPLPAADFPMGGEAAGMHEEGLEASTMIAILLWERAKNDAELRALLPDDEDTLEQWIGWEEQELLLISLGVWAYSGDYGGVPYARLGTVKRPVTLADLPEEIADQLEDAKLPVRFASADRVAPGEHVPVHSWSGMWVDLEGVAHPTEDGTDPATLDEANAAEAEAPWVPEQKVALEGEALLVLLRTTLRQGKEDAERWAASEAKPSGLIGWLTKLFRGDA